MEKLSNQKVTDRVLRPIRIMQFGAGNFQRGFIDWMVEVLNEETSFDSSIAVVKPTAKGNYQELRDQNGLFHVLLNGIKSGELIKERKLITCIQQIVNPHSDWKEYLKLAENPAIRFIISNTTEAGIKFNATDRHDEIPPNEFPAKLTVWLYHRFVYFNADPSKTCIILPLELVEENGEKLKTCILQIRYFVESGSCIYQLDKTANILQYIGR